MSQKLRKKKKQQPKRFPWLVVAVTVVLATAAIFFLARPSEDYSGGTPTIGVDEQNIDMGYVKLGEYRTIKIKVTNTGDGVLGFKEQPHIEVVEGYVAPSDLCWLNDAQPWTRHLCRNAWVHDA